MAKYRDVYSRSGKLDNFLQGYVEAKQKRQALEQKNSSGGTDLKSILQLAQLENMGYFPVGTTKSAIGGATGMMQPGQSIQPQQMPQTRGVAPQGIGQVGMGKQQAQPIVGQSQGSGQGSGQDTSVAQPDMTGLTEKQQTELRGKRAEGLLKADLDAATEFATKKAESQAELEILAPKIQSIYQDYNGAVDEIRQKAPEALKQGFVGWANRQGLKIGSSKFIDEFPLTATLADNLKADATAFAKAAGEVRPTDMDIQRFLSTLLDPRERSLATNVAKAKSQKRRLANQGVTTQWMEPLIAKMENDLKELSWQDMGGGIKIRRVK